MELFRSLFFSLNKAAIKYLVAGGIAVNLYGIERATGDVDIVLQLEKRNLSKFIEVAQKLALKPKIPVKLEDFMDPEKRKSWRMDKGMMVFSLYDPKNPFFLIDIFTEIPFDFDAIYKQRKKVKFEVICRNFSSEKQTKDQAYILYNHNLLIVVKFTDNQVTKNK